MKLDDIPRVSLGFAPTPVEALPKLGGELGVSLSIKRDDFTGFGGGGNKVRKLEFLMADAVAQGVKVLITTGGHQSNHARMVAAAARKFGMHPVLVLRGNPPTQYQGNLLLDRLFGAELEFLDPDAYFDLIGPRMQAHADAAEARGEKAYIIPVGGATPLGALGYVAAARELAQQYDEAGRKAPDYIVLPVGSGGTLAGLTIGVSHYWPDTKIIGVAVSGSAVPFPERIAPMSNAAAKLIAVDREWAPEEIRVETGHVGPAYGVPSEAGNAAIHRAARAEGLLLDPVYTGKAMGGLIDLVETGEIEKGSDVLFLHCGGSPALFPFADVLAGA
ncbi:1-aminocyclopropane-1-carboxylate deaminase/D-cysteine desulfhydrase [Acidimangrovimonas sediminis]|uniref:1-aminocyclopropane-1-carboxylate deaminase/D-cysteine desulfhydrase n=1 Tax=Acidimangrovimonas sediminis TaxID=2056283 RepID=UPI000C80CCAA|nr:D-cysteine desulfhydrase family protein [Acidimangrovimonas sediminis]